MFCSFTVTTFFTKPVADKTPYLLYSSCALCYMGAMVASNHALMYVTYPKQVIYCYDCWSGMIMMSFKLASQNPENSFL